MFIGGTVTSPAEDSCFHIMTLVVKPFLKVLYECTVTPSSRESYLNGFNYSLNACSTGATNTGHSK